MSAYAGPLIPRNNNLLQVFDANNTKSINGNIWTSVISSSSFTFSNTSVTNGFLTISNIPLNTVTINNFNSNQNISVVFSVKSSTSSKGTVFSVYDDTSTLYSASTTTTYNISVNTSNATINSSNAYVSGWANSTVTTYNISVNTSNASLQDVYADCPTYAIAAYFDNDQIYTRFKNLSYDVYNKSFYTPTINDVFVVVFKKSASDASIKIYLNGSLLIQSAADSNLQTFGTTFSVLSSNAQGKVATFSTRYISVYDKELSTDEVLTVTRGISSK